jgi:hypothetical protein
MNEVLKNLRNFEITLLDQQASKQAINPSIPLFEVTLTYLLQFTNRAIALVGDIHSCMYIYVHTPLGLFGLGRAFKRTSCFNTSCQNLLRSLLSF